MTDDFLDNNDLINYETLNSEIELALATLSTVSDTTTTSSLTFDDFEWGLENHYFVPTVILDQDNFDNDPFELEIEL